MVLKETIKHSYTLRYSINQEDQTDDHEPYFFKRKKKYKKKSCNIFHQVSYIVCSVYKMKEL